MRKMTVVIPSESEKNGVLTGWLAYGALLIVGAAIYILCRFFPADVAARAVRAGRAGKLHGGADALRLSLAAYVLLP
jgi:hypothetical protein